MHWSARSCDLAASPQKQTLFLEETKCVWKINACKVNVSLCSSPEDAIYSPNGHLLKCLHPLRNCPNVCY